MVKIFSSNSTSPDDDLTGDDLELMQSLRAKIMRPKYDVKCKRIFELDKVSN